MVLRIHLPGSHSLTNITLTAQIRGPPHCKSTYPTTRRSCTYHSHPSQIYDLNNVPLVTGVSYIKWHLTHSISSEHRGRTPKCPILDHRVEYDYGKVIPVRIGIDKNGSLQECPIEFEILQEFSSSGPVSAGGIASGVPGSSVAAAVVGVAGGGGGTEKIHLGSVRVNLSEYVEESEALLRSSRRVSFNGSDAGRPGTSATSSTRGHSRQRSSLSVGGASTVGGESLLAKSVSSQQSGNTTATGDDPFKQPSTNTTAALPDVEEGVIRRYLLQESRINSTLKVGILMVQVDGERNYVAPPLRTAPVFGGIAGLMASGTEAAALEPPADMVPGGAAPGSGGGGGGVAGLLDGVGVVPEATAGGKTRDLYEMQDMYRRSLAASWASQPGELPADECIEDIFGGGDGFLDSKRGGKQKSNNNNNNKNTTTGDTDEEPVATPGKKGKSDGSSPRGKNNSGGSSKSPAESGSGDDDLGGTVRPHHLARLRHHFHRGSGERVERTTTTAFPAFKDPGTGTGGEGKSGGAGNAEGVSAVHFHSHHHHNPGNPRHRRREEDLEDDDDERPVSRSDSMATTLGGGRGGSERGRDGFKKAREVREFEVREDMVAWTMGGVAT